MFIGGLKKLFYFLSILLQRILFSVLPIHTDMLIIDLQILYVRQLVMGIACLLYNYRVCNKRTYINCLFFKLNSNKSIFNRVVDFIQIITRYDFSYSKELSHFNILIRVLCEYF